MKWVGALLVIVSCGGCGFLLASNDRALERELRQLERAFDWLGCELSSRMWPLPVLFRQVADMLGGNLKRVFLELALELDKNAAPDAHSCMETVLDRYPYLHKKVRLLLSDFGCSLGRYDLAGQLREVMNLQQQAQRLLREHMDGRAERRRCYQTLGLCAGAGLVIVLL